MSPIEIQSRTIGDNLSMVDTQVSKCFPQLSTARFFARFRLTSVPKPLRAPAFQQAFHTHLRARRPVAEIKTSNTKMILVQFSDLARLLRNRRALIVPEYPKQTTSVLIATALVYTLGAGITAGAGTRLVLQLLLAQIFDLCSSQLPTTLRRLALVFVVTTSPYRHRVIYAPAAFLGSGSHF